MKRKLSVSLAVAIAVMTVSITSCGGKDKKDGGIPESILNGGDSARVEYVMRHASPDSVARFLIYGSLGRPGSLRVDSLAMATCQVYESLQGDSLERFSVEYDAVIERLPLADKMRIYALAGTEDPQKLGYKLGLEYVSSILDGSKSAEEVERELSEFKKACGSDTTTYRRFMIGFKTVLRVDSGRNVPPAIVRKYRG